MSSFSDFTPVTLKNLCVSRISKIPLGGIRDPLRKVFEQLNRHKKN
jgi:hypothetical protein